jgi:PAS domain-containing protein
MAGSTPGALCDDGLANAVDPDDCERLRRACRTVVADQLEVVEEEVVLRHPDDTDRRVQIRLTPLTAADGVARGVVGVVQEHDTPEDHRETVLQPTIGYVAHLE